MKGLNREQYDVLKSRFTVAIIWAVRSNCVPAFNREELTTLSSIYESLGYHLETMTCGHCILSMVQIIGKEFYKYEEELKKAEEAARKSARKTIKKEEDHVREESEAGIGHEEDSQLGLSELPDTGRTDGEKARSEAKEEEGRVSSKKKSTSRRHRGRSISESDVREA